MDIIKEFQSRQIDYNKIKEACYFNLVDTRIVDISIIIPVGGRTEFNHIVCGHFKKAIDNIDKKISVTIVEHSNKPEHKDLCYDWVNYIHIPKNSDLFNKCLCFNIGALYSNKSEYYLFHDVDILVPKDFFIKLFKNLINYDALQSYTKQRVLYCNEQLSKEILLNKIDIETLNCKIKEINIGTAGATGGSIFVSKSIFFAVGGYEPEFYTGYSVEDTSFYEKLDFVGKLGFCDNPEIEMFHIYHSDGNKLTKPYDADALSSYRNLDNSKKWEYIKIRSSYLELIYKNEPLKTFLSLSSLEILPENTIFPEILNENLDLRSIKSLPVNFKFPKTINGQLYLNSLENLPENTIFPEILNGSLFLTSLLIFPPCVKLPKVLNNLDLRSLQILPENTIFPEILNGSLNLNSLEVLPENTILPKSITGYLYLKSLKILPENIIFPELITNSLDLSSVKILPDKITFPKILNGSLNLSSLNDNNINHKSLRQLRNIYIRIIDNQFAHAPNSFGCGDLIGILPKYFQWYRGNENIGDVVVITENSYVEIDNCTEKIKILLILEPPSINPDFYKLISNPNNYLKFNYILTYNDELVKLNKNIFIPYYFGGCWIYPKDWKIYEKSKNISVIASAKRITAGQRLRHLVIDKFKDKIEGIYGRGYHFIENKLEGLKDYRYSIVVENEKQANMISEKVIDCFVTGTIPIYYGTKSIFKHFNPKGILYFETLDELENKLTQATENYYNENIDAIKENFVNAEKLAIPENYLWDNFFKFLFTND